MAVSKNNNPVRSVCVDGDHEGQRLDNFLASLLKGVPRAAIYRLIRTGQVRINGGRAKPSSRLSEGDEVRVPPARTRDSREVAVSDQVRSQLRKKILYEDQDLLVIDKPAGMAVHAGSGLAWGLIDALRQDRPGDFLELAHRLDRETSGCLVLARNGQALGHLAAQFRAGSVHKYYLCLMDGRLPQALVEVAAPLSRQSGDAGARPVRIAADGKPALTRFRLLQEFADCSYVEAELLTGRTHQIRAHARHIGQPLAGDARYADRDSLRRWRERGLKRLFLHACRLALIAPSGNDLEFDAPLPEELREVLNRLEQ